MIMKKMYSLHLCCGVLMISSAFVSVSWLPLHLAAVLFSLILLYNACHCRWIPTPLSLCNFLLYMFRLILLSLNISFSLFWWLYDLSCIVLGLLFLAVAMRLFF